MPAQAPEPQGGFTAKAHLPQVFAEGLEDGSGLTDAQLNTFFASMLNASQGPTSLVNRLGVSPVPVCQKFSVTLAQIKALGAVTSGDVLVLLAPAKTVLLDWCIKHTQQFAGPSLTDGSVKLRYGTTPDLSGTQGVTGVVANTTFLSNDGTIVLPDGVSVGFATKAINLNVALTGCNASALTAGAVDVWLTFLVRP